MRTLSRSLPPAGLVVAVAVYALAMAYLESAVVVYLRQALGHGTGDVFPIEIGTELSGRLGWIELGREAATLFMIGSVGWVVGRAGLERLAWAAVVFGIWDIGYYFWLWVFSGWPSALTTWDLLFLLPVPWAGPVWAPVAISAALIGFGLVLAGRYRAGLEARAGLLPVAGLLLGGLVVIVSFTLNAGVVLEGGTPTEFAWPIFLAGVAIGVVAAAAILRTASPAAGGGPA
ncbi:MAG TPA: hypothetical protein VHK63_02795 [Candidatus Limnocylindria bacterium]|nr:hypothetical protein [Candidatus Limnocylindria bacterium]